MIDPKDFYHRHDNPSPSTRRSMWRAVRSGIGEPSGARFFAFERRSFLFGMAAAVALVFAIVGIVTTFQAAIERMQPSAVRIDRAYQSAIREFEGINTVELVKSTDEPSGAGTRSARAEVVRARLQELEDLDHGVATLRQEIKGGDVSALKRSKLQNLYARKLRVLQEMIEQGEIEL